MADNLPEIFEHSCVVTDFIDGLHHVYLDRNGNARLVFYREQRDDDGDNRIRRIVTARMIMPHAAMIEAAGLMVTAAKETACKPEIASRLRELN